MQSLLAGRHKKNPAPAKGRDEFPAVPPFLTALSGPLMRPTEGKPSIGSPGNAGAAAQTTGSGAYQVSRITYQVPRIKCHVSSARCKAAACRLATCRLATCRLAYLQTFTLATCKLSHLPLANSRAFSVPLSGSGGNFHRHPAGRGLQSVPCASLSVSASVLFSVSAFGGAMQLLGVIIAKSANVSRRNHPPAATASSARASTSEARCPTRRITSRSSSVNGSPLRVLTTSSAPRTRSPARRGIAIRERV